MPEAVLIELEGVVVETRALRAEALRRGLEAIGLPDGAEPDETERDLVALVAEREFASRASAGLSLVEGARECILAMHAQARLAVVTRASRRVADLVLEMAGIADAFDCVVAAEDVRLPKPSPEGLTLAIARLSRRRVVDREACLALEDDIDGIRAARAAGVPCIAVGPITVDEAFATGAHAWLPSLRNQTVLTLTELLQSGEEKAR